MTFNRLYNLNSDFHWVEEKKMMLLTWLIGNICFHNKELDIKLPLYHIFRKVLVVQIMKYLMLTKLKSIWTHNYIFLWTFPWPINNPCFCEEIKLEQLGKAWGKGSPWLTSPFWHVFSLLVQASHYLFIELIGQSLSLLTN